MHFLAGILLVLSGAAALTYEVVWVRLLGLSLGTTSASVSTVVAVFFLGLALGSALANRLGRRRNRLWVYVVLELVIAAFGVTLIFCLPRLGQIVAETGRNDAFSRFVVATSVLLVPTACMGATFPLLASLVARETRTFGARIGSLYALNTLGAVLGVVLSGLWLIPRFGLDGASWIAATLNLTVAAIAAVAGFRLSASMTRPDVEPVAQTRQPAVAEPNGPSPRQLPAPREAGGVDTARQRRLALAVLCATGFASIATQVAWTKYLIVFTGGTVYGFSVILAVFLSGIALGSWAMRSILGRIRDHERWLIRGLGLIGASLLLARATLTRVPDILESLNSAQTSAAIRLLSELGTVVAVLILPTMLLGAVFPLALMLFCGGAVAGRQRLGRAYAWNTVASVAGSLCAGFWLIPAFGTDALLALMAGLLLALVLSYPILATQRRLGLEATFAGIVLIGVWWLPSLRYEPLIAAVKYERTPRSQTGPPEFVYLAEGKAGIISMTTHDGSFVTLQNNGLSESGLDLGNPEAGAAVETLLGLVPYLLHPEPKSCFVVGYGGGVTLRALAKTDLQSIEVVELEPKVVEAVRSVLGETAGIDDPRVTLSFNDARNGLLMDKTKYDLIVSQPSHPWLAGAATVFTREFFELGASRLADHGVFGQWLNLFNMDVRTLCSVSNAFFAAFPHGFTMADLQSGDYLFFGSASTTVLPFEKIEARLESKQIQRALQCCEIRDTIDLLRYLALSRQQAMGLCAGQPVNSDLNILTEVRLARLTRQHARLPQAQDPYAFLLENATFDLESLVGLNEPGRILQRLGERLIERDDRAAVRRLIPRLRRWDPGAAEALIARLPARGRTRVGDGP